MALHSITRASVLNAIEQYDLLGREQFLSKLGYGPSRRHFLRLDGHYYDALAILGAATEIEHDGEIPDFSMETMQQVLSSAGFTLSDAPPESWQDLIADLMGLASTRMIESRYRHRLRPTVSVATDAQIGRNLAE